MTTSLNIVAIVGSTSRPSRGHTLVNHIISALQKKVSAAASVIELVDFA